MPLTELHGLAERNEINKENIAEHIKDINTVNEEIVILEPNTNPYIITWLLHDGNVSMKLNTTPLHVALLKKNRTALLFLIAYGGNIHLQFTGMTRTRHTAESFATKFLKDLLPIVIGGADNARDILISEGLLEEEEKFVKPAKH